MTTMTESRVLRYSAPQVALGGWYRIDMVLDLDLGPRLFRVKRIWPRHHADAIETALHSSYRAKTRRRNRRRR